ncbi:hypothetical protein [Streptomyces sp. SID1121]|uniref:hypothetical protein n=1 Tax=Streptomyces sp. SID1121 TaxID=3425888 RepID=UPI004055C667
MTDIVRGDVAAGCDCGRGCGAGDEEPAEAVRTTVPGGADSSPAVPGGNGDSLPAVLPVAPDQDRRRPDGPVMAGDLVDGVRVTGFACVTYPAPLTAANDRLLVEGDADRDLPPDRPVPPSVPSGRLDARLPHQRLPLATVLSARQISRCLPGAVTRLLTDRAARWSSVLRPVADTLRRAGHDLWLSGGAVRELLAGQGPEAVRDLDLAGTAPAGRFTELARQALDGDGLTYECPLTVSPHTLLCTVLAPDRSAPLIEYRGLGVGGFRFPATGSDLVTDSHQRDFRVNTLLYDPERHLVLDPTGHGLDDLRGPRRKLVPVDPSAATEPLTQAAVVLRALKFLLRWAPDDRLDTEELTAWAAGLPQDLTDRVTGHGTAAWAELRALHGECVAGAGADRQLEAVRPLGPGAEGLVRALLGERS